MEMDSLNVEKPRALSTNRGCPMVRQRKTESRSLRVAITAMLEDGFSPEEVVIGLECRLSEVLTVWRKWACL